MSTLREVQVVIEHDATASNASGRQGPAPQLVDAALPFLNGQGRAKSWDDQVSAK
ncbi:MAG TPA: hypothetical protein VN325_10325 [Steroidobacteraceae bacterium]|nr:hypothetical protein [Steroidobacteraceae bacterium]